MDSDDSDCEGNLIIGLQYLTEWGLSPATVKNFEGKLIHKHKQNIKQALLLL